MSSNSKLSISVDKYSGHNSANPEMFINEIDTWIAFNGVTALGNYIYAVGYVGIYPNHDYLIEKYDEAGNRVWSRTSCEKSVSR